MRMKKPCRGGHGSPVDRIFRNCILWGAGQGIEFADSRPEYVSLTYSTVPGGWPGAGNIDADPRFAEAAARGAVAQQGGPIVLRRQPAVFQEMRPMDQVVLEQTAAQARQHQHDSEEAQHQRKPPVLRNRPKYSRKPSGPMKPHTTTQPQLGLHHDL